MNKEELIKLKKNLEKIKRVEERKKCKTKKYLVWNEDYDLDYTEEELKENTNIRKAIELVERYYEEVIRHFIKKNKSFDNINLHLIYSTITPYYLEENKDYNEICQNKKCLPDLVMVQISGYRCNDEKEIINVDVEDEPDKLFKENYDKYIVPYNEFVKELQNRGFEFDEIPTVNEIKDYNLCSRCLVNLTLNLSKKKKKRL